MTSLSCMNSIHYIGIDVSKDTLHINASDLRSSTCSNQAKALVPWLRQLPARAHLVLEASGGYEKLLATLAHRAGVPVSIVNPARVRAFAKARGQRAKTDRIDAYVLAELARRDLVPAIWLPAPGVRAERELARFRLHLVRHRAALKARIHASLIACGHPCPVSDLFGVRGRALLGAFDLPEAWRASTEASLRVIGHLDGEIDACEAELRRQGADHPYVPLLMSAPGIGWVLAYTIAAEIGEIERFSGPKKLTGYTGLCPRVYQSGERDRRGPLAKNGPTYLRWALIEAAVHAARHPAYATHYEATKQRLGRQRGAKVARVEVARKLAEAIWYMLTREQTFAPQGPTPPLAA